MSRANDITSRLTDPSGYTGSHKQRFDADGRGKGKAGRVDRVENDGYVASFKSAKRSKGKARKSSRASAITDRLTNASTYTGSHKARFNSDGSGRGIDGRVERAENDGYVASYKSSKAKAKRAKTGSRAANITDRLTNPSTYTGAHKQRFDSDGRGRGIDGRVERTENDGYVASYKSSKAKAKRAKTGSRASNITDRLTNPSTYTGAHKQRFDSDGRGKGIDGRVERTENDGYTQAYKAARKSKGKAKRGSKASSITDRLTDPSKYTGAHKARFNADGSGRGVEGRVDRSSNDGYVSGYKRGGQ